ncbi:hypothetical protein PCAR4_570249 [Paraburkholderia caribensis]|nr:hypothetical protein PCAR4_570249 [Paraburkholderia caribensis]
MNPSKMATSPQMKKTLHWSDLIGQPSIRFVELIELDSTIYVSY